MAEQALARKEKAKHLLDYIGARRPQLENALSEMARKYMSGEKLVKLLLVAMSRQPKILDCTPNSVLLALMKAGECALDPTGKGGQGHLVPFGTELTFVPGYQGIVLNLMRTGTVEKVEARVVFKGDQFDYCYGLNPRLEHKPVSISATSGSAIWDAIEAAYAIAWLPNGVKPSFVVVPKNDLIRIKNVAKAKADDAPWQLWPDRQSMKTAVKQLSKLLPIDSELVTRMLEVDNEAETGEQELPIDLGDALVVDEKPSRSEALKDQLAAKKEAEKPALKDDPEAPLKRMQAKVLAAVEGDSKMQMALSKALRGLHEAGMAPDWDGLKVSLATLSRDNLLAVKGIGQKTLDALYKIAGVEAPGGEPEESSGAEAATPKEAAEDLSAAAEQKTQDAESSPEPGATPLDFELERVDTVSETNPRYTIRFLVNLASGEQYKIAEDQRHSGELHCNCPEFVAAKDCPHVQVAAERLEG